MPPNKHKAENSFVREPVTPDRCQRAMESVSKKRQQVNVEPVLVDMEQAVRTALVNQRFGTPWEFRSTNQPVANGTSSRKSTSIFPMLLPLKRPRKACGALA